MLLFHSFLANLHSDSALQLLVVILPLLVVAHVVLEAITDMTKGYFHWSNLGQVLYDDFKKVVVIAFTAGIAALSGVNVLLALDAEKAALVALGIGILTECAQEVERLTGLPIAIWQTWFDQLAEKIHLGQDANGTLPVAVPPTSALPTAVGSVPDASPVG